MSEYASRLPALESNIQFDYLFNGTFTQSGGKNKLKTKAEWAQMVPVWQVTVRKFSGN